MERWLKSEILSFDVRDTAVMSDKTCKAANDILKVPIAFTSPFCSCTFTFMSFMYNSSENVEIIVVMFLFLSFRL